MNTLNKSITKEFYVDPDNGFNDITNFWKSEIKNGYKPSSSELLLYAILRGKDYRKGFNPITNQTRIDNGCYKYLAFRQAMAEIFWQGGDQSLWEKFDQFITSDTKNLVKKLLPVKYIDHWSAYYITFPESEAYIDVGVSFTQEVDISSSLPNKKISLIERAITWIKISREN